MAFLAFSAICFLIFAFFAFVASSSVAFSAETWLTTTYFLQDGLSAGSSLSASTSGPLRFSEALVVGCKGNIVTFMSGSGNTSFDVFLTSRGISRGKSSALLIDYNSGSMHVRMLAKLSAIEAGMALCRTLLCNSRMLLLEVSPAFACFYP